MKLILDTSILIDYLRVGKKSEEFIESVKEDTELLIPTIVIFELFAGKSTQNPVVVKKIEAFIKYFKRVELTETIARRAGQIYRDITNALDAPDYIIAASALETTAQLVTLNYKHFQKIPSLIIYEV